MIPTLGWFEMRDQNWDRNSKIAYLAKPSELWPTVFNATLTGNTTQDAGCLSDPLSLSMGCPSSGFADIAEWFIGATYTAARNSPTFNDVFSNAKRAVSFGIVPRWEDARRAVSTTGATVTVVTELTALTLGTFFNYATRNNIGGTRDVLYPRFRIAQDTPTYQPVVHVNCVSDLVKSDRDMRNATFPPIRSPWADDAAYVDDPFVLNTDDPIWDGLPDLQSRFKWFKDTRNIASSSLLALAIVPVEGTNVTVESFQSSGVVACSIDARWAGSAAYFEPKNSTAVSSNVTDYLISSLDSWYRPENRAKFALSELPLNLNLDWAAYLNAKTNQSAYGNEEYAPAIETLLDTPTSVRSNNITSYMAPNITTASLNGAIEESVATLIGIIVADGISRLVDNGHIPWLISESPGEDATFTALWSFIAQNVAYTGLQPEYLLQVMFDRYGYGYRFRSTSSWAAMSALFLYAMITLAYMMVVVTMHIRKRYVGSDGWDNVGDILALAMNSAQSATLYGTSGGIDNGDTWQAIVKVREIGDHHLELQFDADRQGDGGKMVTVGKKYY
ncbi:uncharacterized protein N0V89_006697 [Didymosphaeria variabile]|uniref:Uncharacterized protein n=1 Tax=Didymosphaeria variabile TaxID=1932322 RepID=A0A9W9C9S1_9PLEO|nr:uncharacterized protein N0V89_006697 [Didymosphaeria variabile]KAJ4351357.1 hypothetical protein N0V89_006697 [Didymosphaeria variabile]